VAVLRRLKVDQVNLIALSAHVCRVVADDEAGREAAGRASGR